MKSRHTSQQQGYILISVILAIALISSIAFLLNQEGVVNTHLVTDEAQSDEAHYVAEAALNHAKWLLNTMDCSGYTNIPSTPFGAHSYSASLNQSSGSPVTVTATGRLENGITQSFIFKDIKVTGSSPITVTLQPDSTAGKDTYIQSGNRANRNYGGSNRIHVEQGRRNGLLEFNLSAIPADATITSATLELFLENDGNNAVQINVHRITQAWIEGTKTGNGTADGATWNDYDGIHSWQNSGGDYDPAVIASTVIPRGNNTWHQWDITSLVSNWMDNTVPNRGLLLEQVRSRDRVQFASSENGDDSLNPRLTISYIGECGSGGGPPPGSITIPLPATQDSYLRENSGGNDNYGNSSVLLFGLRDRFRPVVQFDLSSIPPLTTINSAILRFYVNDIGPGTNNDIDINIYRLTQLWQENFVTWRQRINNVNWTSFGGTYDPQNIATLTIPDGDVGIWIEADITPLAQEWLDAVSPNYGVILINSAVTQTIDLNSRESALERPELVITYLPPP